MLIYLSLIETPEDKRKFEVIYNQYKQTMFYAANRILKDSYASEDAVHEAFLRVINNLEKIDENNCHKTKSFLVITTEHIAINIYNKRKGHDLVTFEDFNVWSEDISEENNAINDLMDAILKLPLIYSTVIRLKFSLGFNDAEIAKILNISEPNVRKRISRAREKLAALLHMEEGANE